MVKANTIDDAEVCQIILKKKRDDAIHNTEFSPYMERSSHARLQHRMGCDPVLQKRDALDIFQ